MLDERKDTIMMKLRGEGLQEMAYGKIETPAVMAALATLRAALNRVEDKELHDALEDAAFAWSFAQADTALVVGYQMAQDPGAWLWKEATEAE